MKKIGILIFLVLVVAGNMAFAQDGGSNVIAEGIDFIGLRVPDYTVDYGAMYGFQGFKSKPIEIELENTGSLDIGVKPYFYDGNDVFKYIKFSDESGEDYIAADIDRNIFSTCIPMDYEIVEEEYIFSNPWLLTTWIKLNEIIELISGPQSGIVYFSAVDVGSCD